MTPGADGRDGSGPEEWVSPAEVARAKRIRAVDQAPPTTRKLGAAWVAVGALVGLGVLGMGTIEGIVILAVALAVVVFVLRRRAPLGTPLGVVGFGALPAIVLFLAAANSSGCRRGSKVALHAGELGKHQLVPCDEVVAGYVSMAVFFTMVAIAGVIWLAAAKNTRKQARIELAELRAAGNAPA